MKRTIRLPDTNGIIERRHSEKAWDVSFTVGTTCLRDVLTGLFLLLFDKIQSLHLAGTKEIVLAITRETSHVHRERNLLRIALARTDVEALLSYLLDYERDGRTRVNHIDLELRSADNNDVTLIVRAETSALPISADEAKRLLG